MSVADGRKTLAWGLAVGRRSGEFTAPYSGVRAPLHQTASLPIRGFTCSQSNCSLEELSPQGGRVNIHDLLRDGLHGKFLNPVTAVRVPAAAADFDNLFRYRRCLTPDKVALGGRTD